MAQTMTQTFTYLLPKLPSQPQNPPALPRMQKVQTSQQTLNETLETKLNLSSNLSLPLKPNFSLDVSNVQPFLPNIQPSAEDKVQDRIKIGR